MGSSPHEVSRDRILAIVAPSAVAAVLKAQAGRPIVALLICNQHEDVSELESVIGSLLEAGCEYFVCFGTVSEKLHDSIDELIVDRELPPDRIVMTTWHNDETASEVAEFFVNIAAGKEKSLMLAVLNPKDNALERTLIEQVSV